MTPTQEPIPELDMYLKAVYGKKAHNIVVLDVRDLTSVADVFIICSGKSSRQVMAIAQHIKDALRREKIRPISVEGLTEGHWVLLDFGSVIFHIFYEPIRAFYDLDGLWIDAKRIECRELEKLNEMTEPNNET